MRGCLTLRCSRLAMAGFASLRAWLSSGVMRSDPSPEAQQDAEWRQLRRTNTHRLIMFALLVLLLAVGSMVWATVATYSGHGGS